MKVYLAIWNIIVLASCKCVHQIIKPISSYNDAMLNEKHMIPKVKGGLSNPWGPLGLCHVSTTLVMLLLVGEAMGWHATTMLTLALSP